MAALDSLLYRARNTSDRELRLLVKEVQVLRWLLPQLLERIERTDKNDAREDGAILKMARFLNSRKGGIGDA